MNTPKERVLLVESDPELSDLIARQTLLPLGYRVQVVPSASQAIQESVRFAPDVIVANIVLPGLSGKDMLVALSSQGSEVPIIVIAEKGMESDVIQAFRLGAADFLSSPVREAEVVSAVERVLKQVRSRREKEMLARQLNQTNQELQRRVRELTTIFAIGKAVTSITDQRALFDKIVEGAAYVTEADAGWLLLKDERSKTFLLSACQNMPKSISAKLGQPWDDGLSSLVALSGEALTIHGDPLKRFKVSQLGQAALVVPIKVRNEVVGLLVVVRKALQPFGAGNQALLEAVADYASISLVNSRLFRALEERARFLQQSAEAAVLGERIMDELLHKAGQEVRSPAMVIKGNVDMVLGKEMGKLNVEQTNAMAVVQERLRTINDISDAMIVGQQDGTKQKASTDLNDLVRQAIGRFQAVAQQGGLTLFAELSPKPLFIMANPSHVIKVLDGLVSNAIRFSNQGGQVTIRVDRTKDNMAHILVQDKGVGIEERHIPNMFERGYSMENGVARRYSGLGIGLPLMKEIITIYGGKIWVESRVNEGSAFHIGLPIAAEKV